MVCTNYFHISVTQQDLKSLQSFAARIAELQTSIAHANAAKATPHEAYTQALSTLTWSQYATYVQCMERQNHRQNG